MTSYPLITWTENGETRSARWQSESGMPPPKRVVVADDTMTADTAYRHACEGTAMLWRSDYHNGKQMLQALARRIDGKGKKPARVRKADKDKPAPTPVDVFNLHRLAQSQRGRTLGMLLIPFDADYGIPLRRAPDAKEACAEAWGPADETSVPFVATLRELLGIIGAHEWRKRGVDVAALENTVHPHYGVFSPQRGEYVELVANTPLPTALTANSLAFDIGTGTGVLAAVLAKRGVAKVIATDCDPRALACARENITRLGFDQQVEIVEADLFPPGKAPLVVCNPPWIPARPSSPIEHAIYDQDSAMLRGFLAGLADHLTPDGEGWLILSDIAEHLGLRTRADLAAAIEAGGLRAVGKMEVVPNHPKTRDETDPLHAARAAEVTYMWRLALR
jgi:SAM-dependent methyltransferase